MAKVLIYANTLPSNVGGVAMHIKRFLNYLNNKENVFYDFFISNQIESDEYKGITNFELFKIGKRKEYGLIHVYQFQNWRIHGILLLLKIFYRKKIIVSIRNDRFEEEYLAVKSPVRWVSKLFYKNINSIIAVNQNTNFLFVTRSKLEIIPGFIQPSITEIKIKSLPSKIENFIDNHTFLISSNASKLAFFNNEDLYGLDLLIELGTQLVNRGFSDFGILCVIPNTHNDEYFEVLQKRIIKYSLQNNVIIYRQCLDFLTIIQKSNLIIRATNTDGDANSIREALFLKTPVIASNVTVRPPKTILFKNRNKEDLLEKTIYVMNNYDFVKEQLIGEKTDDNGDKIIQVWNKFL